MPCTNHPAQTTAAGSRAGARARLETSMSTLTPAAAIAAMKKAIEQHAATNTGPGVWVASEYRDDGRVMLAYQVACGGEGPEPHPDITQGDEPWKQWGGDAIIAAAGLDKLPQDGGQDHWTDRDGDEMWAEYVVVQLPQEDD